MPDKPCDLDDPFHPRLTPTEWKMLKLVARGLEDKEIAQMENVSVQTVKTHLSNLRAKTNLKNRVQLAVWYTEEKFAGRADA